MRKPCPKCGTTGLTGAWMDEECPKCGGGGFIASEPKEAPGGRDRPFPATPDGRLVERLCDLEDLSGWEGKFTVSVEERVMAGRDLTLVQRTKAEEILGENSNH